MDIDNKKELIKEAIKEYKLEELKTQKNRVYHNTELLMKNYNRLKMHADNAIYKLSQVFREETIINTKDHDYTTYTLDYDLEYDAIYIGTILKSKVRTAIMLQHMDMALEILKDSVDKEGCNEKFEVLIKLYLLNKTYEELAEYYNCNPMTIRRWKNDILKKLSILLFGYAGLISWA